MQSLVNSVQLIGRLGNDGEVKTTNLGSKVSNVRLATQQFFKNRSGEWVQDTKWHSLVFWGKLAERLEKSAKKGSRIAVQGALLQRSYMDSNDIEREVYEIRVNRFIVLDNAKAKTASAALPESQTA
ncbi:single-stranded DNA-binding protein [Sphingobacterium sp. UT-1RO-CII-1]|uniref:single-stranded DNA-binding protein n=1 Tax=Sphingobacterium sp. UT-1RO-CII-1 TaxID=2995225 RepID=UPI00227D1289|nr:single-stranded DNA-binding protein [Sphingobacterium sp. UT-1RO-CII-1]MCY4780491.1 single-stranded DNA-binding protein [Sphingobacterium sp. UT-1RO-CII-1]